MRETLTRSRGPDRKPGHQPLQSAPILFIERARFGRVDIKNRDQGIIGVDDRHHDLGARAGVAGDVSGKFIHVRDDYRSALRRGSSAYPSPEGDLQAAERALIRPDAQERFRFHHAIEARPQVAKAVMDEGAHGRHGRDGIGHAMQNGADAIIESPVRLGFRQPSEILRVLSH